MKLSTSVLNIWTKELGQLPSDQMRILELLILLPQLSADLGETQTPHNKNANVLTWPVIAVEVIQPAAFLHQLDGPWGVEPGGVAVQPLVLFPLAALKSTLVGPLCSPVIIVVHTFSGLHLSHTVPWCGQKALVSMHRNELKRSGGKPRQMAQDSLCASNETSCSRDDHLSGT